jgi:hypothetical protein
VAPVTALAGAEHAPGLIVWLSQNWLWIVIWLWILGGFGAAGEWLRRVRHGSRRARALRHQRRVELAYAKAGRPYPRRTARPVAPLTPPEARVYQPVADAGEFELPAAVIPAPPGAQPVRRVPGPCRHEKIVPVFTDLEGNSEMTLVRWVCASTRCDAEFPAGVAIYEEPAP